MSLYNALMFSLEATIHSAVDVNMADAFIHMDNKAKEINQLTSMNAAMRSQVDELDAYSHSDYLIIYGITEAYAEVEVRPYWNQ